MLHEFVAAAQTVVIQHPVIIHHNGVIERTALGKADRAEELHIVHKAKRARPGHVLLIGVVGEVDLRALNRGVNRRMVKINGKFKTEAEMRLKLRPLSFFLHLNRLQNPHKLLRSILLNDTGRVNQENEARC